MIRSTSSSTPSTQAVRKTISRSRNGCAVCKSKRLKCDEARPSCSRCHRLGIPCPGYQKPLKWTRGTKSVGEKSTNLSAASDQSVIPARENVASDINQSTGPGPACTDLYPSPGFLEQLGDIFDPSAIGLCEADNLNSPFSCTAPSAETSPSAQQKLAYTPDTVHTEREEKESWNNVLVGTAQRGFRLEDRHGKRPLEFLNQLPLSQALQDHSSVLVEYYFKEVCGMMSCYDSQLNPYRTAVSNTWANSRLLYYVTQSMAAACLAEVSPHLARLGRQLRDEAISCLSQEAVDSQSDTVSMLAVVMLGMSLCWHEAGDLGRSEFRILAKKVLSSQVREGGLEQIDKRKDFFFYNSFVYWRLLLSFVSDDNIAPTQDHTLQPQFPHSMLIDRHVPRMPHPQTGVGIEVQELVAEVGSLVRRERKRIRNRRGASRGDIELAEAAIREAESLYARLCAIDLQLEAMILDSGDDVTPAAHLVQVAEAYRCTGLLQLFRNFPDLLSLRSSSNDATDLLATLDHTASGLSSLGDQLLANTRLTSLALHIMDLVDEIPVSSRSRSIQPLLLVSIASELSMHRTYGIVTNPPEICVESIASSPRFKEPYTMTDVLHARRSLASRLAYLENVLAAKPVRRMLQLIRTTWTQMDETQKDVYWVDVMIENDFETLMG